MPAIAPRGMKFQFYDVKKYKTMFLFSIGHAISELRARLPHALRGTRFLLRVGDMHLC
jgi:hypothetical protein